MVRSGLEGRRLDFYERKAFMGRPSVMALLACDSHVHLFDPDRFPNASSRAHAPGRAIRGITVKLALLALAALH